MINSPVAGFEPNVLAVVGMDDALALLIFSVAAIWTESLLLGAGQPSAVEMVTLPAYEIGGAVLLGLVLGALLNLLLRRITRHLDAMVTCIAFLLLGVGLAQALALSFILTAMILGMFVVNRSQEHGLHVRYTIERTGPIIYTLFFALVGARVQLSLLPTMGVLGLAYVLLRSAGKFAGAWLGGQAGQAEPVVRNNLGLGLLWQAGVAIGLALHSYERFCECGLEGEALGALVVSVVTASTFVLQLVGPLGAKWAVSRAGEIGRATAEDEPWG